MVHLIVFQYDLSSAHLANELQELAVLHFGVGISGQHVSEGLGVPLSGCLSLLVRPTDRSSCASLCAVKLRSPLVVRLLGKLICPSLPLCICLEGHR